MGVLHRKLYRTMLKSWGQSLAVVAVVLCGIASYICVYSAYLNLMLTRDTYYSDYRLADFEILVERAPETALFKVEEIDGVRQARGRIVQDVNVDVEGVDEPRIGRMISMPSTHEPVLNDIVLLAGRYFDGSAQDEVIMSERFAEENHLTVGDRIQVSVDNKKYSLRIVGLGLSPEYVYMIRNVQSLFPSPERFGIIWVPQDFAETALDMRAACNSILGSVDNPDQLDAILDQADKLLDTYGVFARTKKSEQISNRFLSDEIRGLGVSARIIPTLFLGIAALILLILLNRMVRTERTQIGLMKAYGYSNLTVALHYIEYALLLSVLGCIGGFFLGQWMSFQMIQLYVDMYQFPSLQARIYPYVLTRSMGSALVFGVLGAVAAAIQAANIHPAESMRPESPKIAHKVWLEHWPFAWRQLSFTWKMILRNISRNKFRAGLNVFGVSISTALLIMGFFSQDAMDFGLKFQFEEVQREDVKLSFPTEHDIETLYDVARFDHIRRAEPLLEYPFEVRSAWRTKDIVVIGMPREAELQKIMNFKKEMVDVGATGLVMSDHLADELQVGVGSTVTLKPLMGRVTKEKEVTVRRVSQQFLGTSAFMNIDALSRVLDEPFAMNAALLRIDEGSGAAINRQFKDVAGISAVSFSKDAYNGLVESLGKSMAIMNTILLIFAGVISFSIIYNVTTVALSERQRELASLRVLGLSTTEVGRILYHENTSLGVVGIVCGIPLGMGICRILVEAYSNDLYRLPYHIERRTFVISILLTLFFVLLANFAVRRKIQRLDLVEVLKERE